MAIEPTTCRAYDCTLETLRHDWPLYLLFTNTIQILSNKSINPNQCIRNPNSQTSRTTFSHIFSRNSTTAGVVRLNTEQSKQRKLNAVSSPRKIRISSSKQAISSINKHARANTQQLGSARQRRLQFSPFL